MPALLEEPPHPRCHVRATVSPVGEGIQFRSVSLYERIGGRSGNACLLKADQYDSPYRVGRLSPVRFGASTSPDHGSRQKKIKKNPKCDDFFH